MDRTTRWTVRIVVSLVALYVCIILIHLVARVIRVAVVSPPVINPAIKDQTLAWVLAFLDAFFGYDFGAPTMWAEHQASAIAMSSVLVVASLIALSAYKEHRRNHPLPRP